LLAQNLIRSIRFIRLRLLSGLKCELPTYWEAPVQKSIRLLKILELCSRTPMTTAPRRSFILFNSKAFNHFCPSGRRQNYFAF
jgi:hypothetical protein